MAFLMQAALGLARLAAEPTFQETLVEKGVLAPLLSLASQSLFETMQVISSTLRTLWATR